MFKDRKNVLGMQVRKKMSPSRREDGENTRGSSSGLGSGHITQGPVPGLMYALTMNGYVVL